MKTDKQRIIISVTNDLVTDQRVHKVASSLLNHGYSVLLIGRKLKHSQTISRNYECKRLKLFFTKGPFFYIEYNIRLFLFLLFSSSDIFLSNDLDTLLSNFLASKIRRKPLVYDSHELFTQVPELIHRPKVQEIWRKIEAKTLPHIKYSYTVCQSIADYYKKEYGIEMKVVRNIPVCNSQTQIQSQSKKENIILYQGAVNIGRGIDLIIKALKFLPNAEFWVIGDGDVLDKMKKLAEQESVNKRVKFFGRLAFEELQKYTQQATVGISMEENLGLNYYFALPNKLFDYIQSEIPILGFDLPEIKRVISHYNIGEIIKTREPQLVAKALEKFISNNDEYNIWKENLKIARTELCWQNEEKVLLSVYESIKHQ